MCPQFPLRWPGDAMIHVIIHNKSPNKNYITVYNNKCFSSNISDFKHNDAKQKEEVRMRAHAQQGSWVPEDTWRMDTTLPVQARAQLRTFFSNVWRARLGAGLMHRSTR